jgi:hypothetical protein
MERGSLTTTSFSFFVLATCRQRLSPSDVSIASELHSPDEWNELVFAISSYEVGDYRVESAYKCSYWFGEVRSAAYPAISDGWKD